MKTKLTTRRLRLVPMDEPALLEKQAAETDEHLKKAYGEMLAGLKSQPESALWHTEWRIELKSSGEHVGGAGFKGPPVDGVAEIGCGVEEAHRGSGYAAEAVKALCEWAFGRGAYWITAAAAADNGASRRVLADSGFSCIGSGGEGELWEKEKPKFGWLQIFMSIGLSCGLALGAALGGELPGASVGIGMCVGLGIGAAAGAAVDLIDVRARRRMRPRAQEAEAAGPETADDGAKPAEGPQKPEPSVPAGADAPEETPAEAPGDNEAPERGPEDPEKTEGTDAPEETPAEAPGDNGAPERGPEDPEEAQETEAPEETPAE
ncbi:MAG: GNAT family N-acetyltransferase [Clostridia bacterium]|nr:GNAT family N-acetyltransferase [Clostridia bacterium]